MHVRHLLTLAGCDFAAGEGRLGANGWVLASGADAVGAELRFSRDGFSARPVCNNVSGTYTTSGTQIDFDVTGSTYAHCGEGMAAELAFNEALEAAERYEVDGDRLFLRGPSADLVFQRLAE